jgi:hypothetical protein
MGAANKKSTKKSVKKQPNAGTSPIASPVTDPVEHANEEKPELVAFVHDVEKMPDGDSKSSLIEYIEAVGHKQPKPAWKTLYYDLAKKVGEAEAEKIEKQTYLEDHYRQSLKECDEFKTRYEAASLEMAELTQNLDDARRQCLAHAQIIKQRDGEVAGLRHDVSTYHATVKQLARAGRTINLPFGYGFRFTFIK